MSTKPEILHSGLINNLLPIERHSSRCVDMFVDEVTSRLPPDLISVDTVATECTLEDGNLIFIFSRYFDEQENRERVLYRILRQKAVPAGEDYAADSSEEAVALLDEMWDYMVWPEENYTDMVVEPPSDLRPRHRGFTMRDFYELMLMLEDVPKYGEHEV